MFNDDKNSNYIAMPPESEMRRLFIERRAKQALWLVIAFALVLIVPFLI